MYTRSLIFIFLISFSLGSTAQVIERSAADSGFTLKDRYYKKYRSKSKAGWLLLGGGVVLGVVGAATVDKKDDKWGPSFAVLPALGICSILTSVPMFISAYVNKRKARRLE